MKPITYKDAKTYYTKALCDLAQEYSDYIFTAIEVMVEYGEDDDTKELINEWTQIRHTIICELGLAN